MNKKEIYDELKDQGVKLPRSCQFMNPDELNELYEQHFGRKPGEPVQSSEKSDDVEFRPHWLKFIDSGWCPELNRSYFSGSFVARTPEEYNALKVYAVSDEVIE